MQINNYTQWGPLPSTAPAAPARTKSDVPLAGKAFEETERTDVFEKSGAAEPRKEADAAGAYGAAAEYKTDFEKVAAMKADLSKNIGAFKQMVRAMLEKQGFLADGAADVLIRIDKETQVSAQEAISEDGYWGVNKTSERIVDFAKALSGGDPSKIPLLKQAVLDGFAEAEKAWGGALPEITGRTRDRIMELFDEWEKSGEAAADEAAPLDAQA
jgi:hypothetical protein